ncbi:MAG TPA: metallophosphoesterase, partial [Spirochaetota bacterium]|nr:metallophosphoesterase [Spirochaetota bacterium]
MFLVSFIAIFAILSALAYRFTRSLFPEGRKISVIVIALFAILFSSFIVRRYFHAPPDNAALSLFLIAGNFHILAVLYLAISCILTESLVFAFRASGLPGTGKILRFRKYISYALLSITAIAIIAGYINTLSLKTVHYNLTIAKQAPVRTLRIAAVSDIHAGDIIREERVRKIADKINSLKPDCVIIAGDLFDHSVDDVISNGTLSPLKSVNAKYGKFIALGNHDYFDNGDKVTRYAKSLGFTVLRDRVISAGNAFYVAGRDDYAIARRTGMNRKDISEIIRGVDRAIPLILIDHQPNTVDEAIANGIDLQISGHTHNGQ